eukprot:TRINITY_DN10683_c0_g1_i2.p1 TRINITY_DN10683_c0_g1~~TRINITY_DN10683_c0_g1_i2.p1  ORF type:complete len:116 (-),score=18.69 TRINITY_DN10683_c0_g1_i2:239-586(-)
MEEVETLIRDFNSLIYSNLQQGPGIFLSGLEHLSVLMKALAGIDYMDGPLSKEYKAIRAAMVVRDKIKFLDEVRNLETRVTLLLRAKINDGDDDEVKKRLSSLTLTSSERNNLSG